MQWFKDLRIGTKLLISNALLGLLIVILALVAVQRLGVIGQNVQNVDTIMKAVDVLLQADRDLHQVLVAERSMLFSRTGSEDFIQEAKAHEENIVQAHERAETFHSLIQDPTIDEMYQLYDSHRLEWEKLTRQIRTEREADTRSGRRTAIDISFGSGQVAFNAMREQIDLMVEHVEAAASESAQQTRASVTSTQATVVTLLLVSLAIGIAIAYFFPRFIVKAMREMTDRINELAGGGGDLTRKLEVSSKDELGQLAEAVNRFIDSLRGLLAHIIDLGQQFSQQASQLNEASERNHQLAAGAMSETDMLATSITQMSASVQEVAQNASGAATQAQQANEESQKGQNVVLATKSSIHSLSDEVQRSAEAIERLKQDAGNIDAVVNVIRGIAEQTNLLALNAAIEAARAGEQGRGFAVVADEVRALASRTQTSTEEIQEMIGALQQSAGNAFETMQQGRQSTEQAVEQSHEARTSLEAINSAIALMTDMNTQIAAAAEQQSAVSGEISENANKLSMFSKDASDLSDDVKAAAGHMASMAEELADKLSRFRV